MEGFLVMLVVFLLSGLANWIQKRQREQSEAEEEREWQQNPPSGPRPVSPRVPPLAQPPAMDEPRRPRVDWERELRRLLEPNEETIGPKPLSRPPPPVVTVRKETPPPVSVPVPSPVLQAPLTRSAGEEGPAPSSLLAESRQAYARAQQLHEAAMVRVQKVVEQTVQQGPRRPSGAAVPMAASDLSATVTMLKHPQTIRRAFILTTILGAPKALGGEALPSR